MAQIDNHKTRNTSSAGSGAEQSRDFVGAAVPTLELLKAYDDLTDVSHFHLFCLGLLIN